MEKTTFTPGPWRKGRRDPLDILSQNNWLVCRVRTDIHSNDAFDAVSANANLIAAAPELYEALRDFFENPDFVCTVGGNPIRVQAMMARGIAALKKARGEP